MMRSSAGEGGRLPFRTMTRTAIHRYLQAAVLAPLFVLGAGAAMVWGPWSPLALDRANSLYAAGDSACAYAAYLAVVDGWHTPATRAEAALRAGLLADERGEGARAAGLVTRATDLAPDAATRARLYVQLAAIQERDLADLDAAAESWDRAAQAVDEPRYRVSAARLWEKAGDSARALLAWRTAAPALAAVDATLHAEARANIARLGARVDGAADAAPADESGDGAGDAAGDPPAAELQ